MYQGNWVYVPPGVGSGTFPSNGWDPATGAPPNGITQVLAVHAALLAVGKGKILYFGGNQGTYEPSTWEAINKGDGVVVKNDPNNPYALGKWEIDHTRIYDCATQQISNPVPADPTNPNAQLDNSPDTDFFVPAMLS